MTRQEHLRQLISNAVQLTHAWQKMAGNTDLSDPVALDTLAMQSSAVGQAMTIVTDRAAETSGAILDSEG